MARDFEITKDEQHEINRFSKLNSAYKDMKAKHYLLLEEVNQVNDAIDALQFG